MLFLGLDVGMQRAKAIVCDEKGEVIAQSSRPIVKDSREKELPGEWKEQDALSLWKGASSCLQEAVNYLMREGFSPQDIKAISVTSPLGSIVPIGTDNEPLRKAIMPDDNRAAEEARLTNTAGEQLTAKLGFSFKASHALPKILWIKRKEPNTYDLTKKFLHITDFIIGKLTGNYSTTDSSNAFQTGYDPAGKRWSRFLSQELGISPQLLPRVVNPGTIIGPVSSKCARETELSQEISVTAGMTNEIASLISTGAVSPGEWLSITGTTLSVKGVSEKLIKDREKRVCCHPHPDGYWIPEGSGSVGDECLKDKFGEDDLTELDKYIPERAPTHMIVYPLVRTGERLPFVNPEAEGFIIGRPKDKYELYAAYLEGMGLVEKWIYELMEELGAPVGERIYAAGERIQNREWLQVRANILKKTLVRPKAVEPAFGAAIAAASQITYNDIIEAAGKMVKADLEVEPQPENIKFYATKYRKFRNACRAIGYE